MKRTRGAVLSTLVAGLLWGSSFAVIKVGLRSIDPYWFVFLRFLMASLIALAISALTGRLTRVLPLLRDPVVIWLGVSNAAGFVFQFKGQTMTTAANAALLINIATIFVAIASRFVFRERFGTIKLLSVALGMAGVFLVTTGGHLQATPGASIGGDLMILAAAFLWTFFIVLDKHLVGRHEVDVRALTTAMVVVTGVASLPVALVFGRGGFPGLTGQWWTIPYTAVFCTVVPFFLWTSGLRYITATTSSVIMLTEVVFALGLATVLLGESLSPVAIVGSVLILAGVALVSRDKGEAAPIGPDVVPEEPLAPASEH